MKKESHHLPKIGANQQYSKYLFPSWKMFILICIALLSSTYLDSKTPKLYGKLIKMIQNGQLEESTGTAINLFLSTIFSAVFYTASSYLISISGEAISSLLRKDLFESVQAMPFWWFANQKTGKFISLYNNQLHGAHNSITRTIPRIILNVFTIIMSAYQLVGSAWNVGIGLIILLPLVSLLTGFLETKILKSEKKVMELKSNMNEHLKHSLSTNAALASWNFGLQNHFKADFLSNSKDMQHSQQQLSWTSDVYSRAVQVIFYFVFQMGFFLLTVVVTGNVDVSESISMLNIMNKLQQPILSLGNIKLELASAQLCFESIFEQIELSKKWKKDLETLQDPALPDWSQPITINNVSFAYDTFGHSSPIEVDAADKQELVLRKVDAQIRPNSKCALIGRNGSGKTTLAYIIANLFHPKEGFISLGEIRFSLLDQEQLRKQIGILDSDPWFLHDSIMANFELIAPTSSLEDIKAACRTVFILDWIESLPNGFKTVLGENGFRLSSGQKQRLALARLILKKPKLLILDEFNSHLDILTERAIWNNLIQEFQYSFLIVITHRTSILRSVDHIIVLDNGFVIEQGSPEELKRNGGIWSQMDAL